MMSSRSNSILAGRLAPLQAGIESESQERIQQLMQDAGPKKDAVSKDSAHLVVAAIRGFSIEAMFHQDTKGITACLESFKSLLREHQKTNAGN